MNPYVVVTGADEFVGGCLIEHLKRHKTSVVGIVGPTVNEELVVGASAVFHMSSPQVADPEIDLREMMHHTFSNSKALFDLCQKSLTPFFYTTSAVVYGDKKNNIEKPEFESPLTPYARAKLLFDTYVRCFLDVSESQIVGVRLFNVYGPGEQKLDKPSLIHKFYKQAKEDKVVRPFSGSQAVFRDYIYIDDVIEVIAHLYSKKSPSGIYNCGTGTCVTSNEIIRNLKRYMIFKEEVINFPEELKATYQKYTRAVDSRLLQTGYAREFVNLSEGMDKYISYLKKAEKDI